MSRYIDIAVIVAALLIIAMVAVAKGTEPIVFCEAPEVQSRQGYPDAALLADRVHEHQRTRSANAHRAHRAATADERGVRHGQASV